MSSIEPSEIAARVVIDILGAVVGMTAEVLHLLFHRSYLLENWESWSSWRSHNIIVSIIIGGVAGLIAAELICRRAMPSGDRGA
ncbi:MAG: hypothetical protein V5A84_03030 [Planctomycetota bacterium]